MLMLPDTILLSFLQQQMLDLTGLVIRSRQMDRLRVWKSRLESLLGKNKKKGNTTSKILFVAKQEGTETLMKFHPNSGFSKIYVIGVLGLYGTHLMIKISVARVVPDGTSGQKPSRPSCFWQKNAKIIAILRSKIGPWIYSAPMYCRFLMS